MEYCACAGDSGLDADSGQPTGCLAYVGCIQACLFPPADSGQDGGTLMECGTLCMGAANTQQQGEGTALLGCLGQSCATSATCAQ